jgi:hypothetical protein
MAKSTIKTGTKVQFKGYSDDNPDGALIKGETVKIIGYDPEEKTYAVENEDGVQDSLFVTEFDIAEAKAGKAGKAAAPAAAPAKKAGRKAAVVEEEDEEEVEEAPATTSKASKAKAGKAAKATEAKAAKTKTAPTKTAKAKAPKEEVQEAPLPAFKQTASVKEVLASHEGDAIAAATELSESKEKTVFTLGGVLAYIKRNDLHTEILSDEKDEETGDYLPAYEAGLKGFNAYVQDTLGLASRKAHYYVDLYEKFSQITTEAKISKIGWTKLRELIPLALDKSNVDEWIDFAKSSSTAEVKAEVVKTLVKSGEKLHGNRNTSEKTTYKLAFFEDQAAMVEEAFAKAQEVIGEDKSQAECLVHIIQEWMTMDSYDLEEEDVDDLDEEGDDD